MVQAGLSALFVLLIAAHVAGLIHIASMQRAEDWLYDAWLMRTAPVGVDDRVAILDIDEASLKSLGRWPWSRDTMTTLVEQLFDHYGVAAVGFDVVFAEPDTSSGLDTLKQLAYRDLAGSRDFRAALEQLAPRLDYDARFAQALAERPISLGYYFIRKVWRRQTCMLPPPLLPPEAFSPCSTGTPPPTGYGATGRLPAGGAGRRFLLNMRATRTDAGRWPGQSFSARAITSLSASPAVAFGGIPLAGIDQHRTGRRIGRRGGGGWPRVPLSADGTVHVPYRAGSPFPTFGGTGAGRQGAAGTAEIASCAGIDRAGLADRGDAIFQCLSGVEIHAHQIRRHARGIHARHAAVGADARLAPCCCWGLVDGVSAASGRPPAGGHHRLLARNAAAYVAAWSRFWGADGGADADGVGLYGLNTVTAFCRNARSKRPIPHVRPVRAARRPPK